MGIELLCDWVGYTCKWISNNISFSKYLESLLKKKMFLLRNMNAKTKQNIVLNVIYTIKLNVQGGEVIFYSF